MTDTTAEPALRLGPTAIVWLLGVSQIIGYGTLYYSFSILFGDVSVTLGWPVAWLYGSLSVALLAGGLVAPVVGAQIDRHGAGAVMAVGSVLATLALVAAGVAPDALWFALAIVGTGVAGTLALYDAAFTALVQVTGAEARLRITHLTLIAGFASSIFWPLTTWLHGLMGWREIFLGFAALNLLVCLPIHLVVMAQPRRDLGHAPVETHAPVPPARQRRMLWLVTLGFALAGFSLSALLAQLVPLLTALGLGASALLVSTLFGPAQVLVRFVNMLVGMKRHPLAATLIALGLLPVAVLILMWSAPLALGAVAFAVLLGFASGLKSIVQGTLPLALFGSGSYGSRLGGMAAVRQVLAAIAPFALALSIEWLGASVALLVIAVVAALGFAAMLEVARLKGQRS